MYVVPHAGTWIEIDIWEFINSEHIVVPHAGTWIEIADRNWGFLPASTSFPTRERGLKSKYKQSYIRAFGRSPRGNVD